MTGSRRPNRSLAGLRLRVSSTAELQAFYTTTLGMTATVSEHIVALGYGGKGAQLQLEPVVSDVAYHYTRLDEYWKIGITLPNVDLAYRQLTDAGIAVSEPRQFYDVGYLCHLRDPHGYCIELLQHTFEGQRRTAEGDPNVALGGGAQIGQITLRTRQVESVLRHYQQDLGMRLLSIQPVQRHDFTLYFLAFTSEGVPGTDLRAVANRPWLYQRPYTTLELQALPGTGEALRKTADGEPGYAGLRIEQGRS